MALNKYKNILSLCCLYINLKIECEIIAIQFLHLVIWQTLLSKATYNWDNYIIIQYTGILIHTLMLGGINRD